MRILSLEGKLAALLVASVTLGAGVAVLADLLLPTDILAFTISLLVVIPVAVLTARRLMQPIAELVRTLSGAVASFRDGDFSFSIYSGRRDEIGELVTAHNELGRVLREERQHLFQRELLLHTVVQNTPTALLLVDSHDHLVYGNTAARQLLNAGRKLEGASFSAILADCPAALREAVASDRDSIFSVMIDGEEESFHVAQRGFQLNGQPHRLLLVRRVTRELGRQEVATWKKVIRVISHELNNSLAPISSLAHSGRALVERGDTAKLARVFETIEERTRHLDTFIRGYATFAKLPTPRVERVEWEPFLANLREHHGFNLVGNDASVVNDDHARRQIDQAAAVGHDHHRLVRGKAAQTFLERGFGREVHGARRLVEEEHRRVHQHGACDRHFLPLAAGQRFATLADQHVEALGMAIDELGQPGHLCSVHDRRVVGIRRADGDVLAQRAVKERRVLADEAYVAPQIGRIELA